MWSFVRIRCYLRQIGNSYGHTMNERSQLKIQNMQSGLISSHEIKRMILHLMRDQGVRLDDIIEGSGVDASIIERSRYPIKPEQELALYSRIAELNNDPLLGVKIGSSMGIETYGLVGYGMLISDTFYDALKFGADYCQLLGWSSRMKIVQDTFKGRNLVGWEMEPSTVDMATIVFETEDSFVGFNNVFSAVLDGKPEYSLVTLAHECPPEVKAELVKVFGKNIIYNAASYRIMFSRDVLSGELPFSSIGQMALIREMCRDSVSRLRAGQDLVATVDRYLTLNLDKAPDVADAAKFFGMSERTFRRKLDGHNTKFRVILENVREREACRYLMASDMTVEAIALALGYSEARTFRVAFRKWTGLTPVGWREKSYQSRQVPVQQGHN